MGQALGCFEHPVTQDQHDERTAVEAAGSANHPERLSMDITQRPEPAATVLPPSRCISGSNQEAPRPSPYSRDKLTGNVLSMDKLTGTFLCQDRLTGTVLSMDKLTGNVLSLDQLTGQVVSLDKLTGKVVSKERLTVKAMSCQGRLGVPVPSLAKLAGKAHKRALRAQLEVRIAAVDAKTASINNNPDAADSTATPPEVMHEQEREQCNSCKLDQRCMENEFCTTDMGTMDIRINSNEMDALPLSAENDSSTQASKEGAVQDLSSLRPRCPICLDSYSHVQLRPCCHELCNNCAVQMVMWQVVTKPVACPMCHTAVAALGSPADDRMAKPVA